MMLLDQGHLFRAHYAKPKTRVNALIWMEIKSKDILKERKLSGNTCIMLNNAML